LTLWQKRTSRKRSKNGEEDGTGVYMRERTNSRVRAADRPYGEFYDFYSFSPEYSGYYIVYPALKFNISCLIHTDSSIRLRCVVLNPSASS
jgi:hypothetical protein